MPPFPPPGMTPKGKGCIHGAVRLTAGFSVLHPLYRHHRSVYLAERDFSDSDLSVLGSLTQEG